MFISKGGESNTMTITTHTRPIKKEETTPWLVPSTKEKKTSKKIVGLDKGLASYWSQKTLVMFSHLKP
jgi:hypothetical protein